MSTILFDARWIGAHGIGRFARELFDGLGGLTPIDVRGRPMSPLDPLRLARAIRRACPDVYFSPGFNPPLGRPAPFVFTIHDLIHLTDPHETNTAKRLYYHLVVRPATRRAFKVLTVSQYSKRQIIEWAGLADNQVVVVGNGVGGAFAQDGLRYEPGYPYLLNVGNHKPHKNVPRLLEAFLRSGCDESVRLVLTGGPSDNLQRLIGRLGLEGRVVFSGLHDDEELAAYYRGATATVLPSVCEGFGLAVVEAMACGTAVVSSRAGAIPEVAGDAAMLVDPTDVDAIAAALRRIVDDEALRTDLAEQGRRRAEVFTWGQVVDRVREVLDRAADR